MTDNNGSRTCSKCKESKPVEGFSRDSSKASGRKSQCKACRSGGSVHRTYATTPDELKAYNRAATRRYRARNLEKIQAADRARYREAPEKMHRYYLGNIHSWWEREYIRRASSYGTPVVVVPFTKEDLIRAYSDACHWCGGAFEELDHAQAVRDGGAHTIENCRPSCRECNVAREATANANRRTPGTI